MSHHTSPTFAKSRFVWSSHNLSTTSRCIEGRGGGSLLLSCILSLSLSFKKKLMEESLDSVIIYKMDSSEQLGSFFFLLGIAVLCVCVLSSSPFSLSLLVWVEEPLDSVMHKVVRSSFQISRWKRRAFQAFQGFLCFDIGWGEFVGHDDDWWGSEREMIGFLKFFWIVEREMGEGVWGVWVFLEGCSHSEFGVELHSS